MEIIQDLKNFNKDKYPILIMGIGNFDGVHLGHQFIIKKIVKRARTLKGKSLIFTFPVHPLNVLKEKGLRPQLTTLSQKLNLFRFLDVNICLLADFNREFAEISPFNFARKVLKDILGVKEVFLGENYRFGKNRRGNIENLKRWSKRLAFKVKALPLFKFKKKLVNSTGIRELIKNGDIEGATLLLGRPYIISGEVIKGSNRGISLGFPTANISSYLNLILKDGIYIVEVEKQGKTYHGLLNLGRRPTFEEHKRVVEIYLFNFTGNLYGEELSIKVLLRLRDELKFSSKHALINQIREDVKQAKAFFSKPR